MKRTLLFIACVLASLTMPAQDELTVEDIQNSGCLDKTQEELLPTIVLTKEGSVLSVQLLNYEAYDATTDFNVTSSISDDEPCSVTINVAPVIPEGAQVGIKEWVCLFNVSFTVRDLEPNRFYLDCWWYKGLVELTEGEPLVLEYKVENVTIDGMSFRLLKVMHKAMLMNWTTTEEELYIPAEVNYEGEAYTVTSISKDAFWNVDYATKVTVPKTIRSMDIDYDDAIYANPFRECKSLEWIEVEDGCPLFSSVDGVLFAEDKTMLLGYPIASPRETYTVPEGVTYIRSGAFVHNKYLQKLVIPEKVTYLGWHLFDDTKSLEELYIRGVLEPDCMSDLFGGMDTKVAVYVQPSEVERYKAVYKGPVYSLPEAQDDSDYIPFVKEDKRWNVFRSDYDTGIHLVQYTFPMNEKVVDSETGKTYLMMYQKEDDSAPIFLGGLREENRKVYFIGPDAITTDETFLFDYSLKAGDTYWAHSDDEGKMVSYKVISVDDYQEGPEVIRYDYNQEGSLIKHHRYLKKWTVCRTDNESLQKTWIEGVGSLEGPLGNLHDVVLPGMTKDYLGYVEYLDYDFIYLPFSFCDTLWKQASGCDLPTGEADHSWDDLHHQLTYELEGDRLHVYGKAYTNCGPNNYAYFIREPFGEPTDDFSVHKIHFEIQPVEPIATCMALHATDFYVSGFDPNLNYIVVDNQGVEHPVINKNIQMAYRPMIEEGKVWKVVDITSGNPAQCVEYYYFDGDTIFDGRTCKQMMCQLCINPDYAESHFTSMPPLLSYIGAWYEEDRKVYFCNATDNQFKLMYDFSIEANDTLEIDNHPYLYVIGPRQTGGISGFKGVYRDVWECIDGEHIYRCAPWLEGVGIIYGPPTLNVFNVELGDPRCFLMSCTVGDEVIYYDSEEDDPYVMGARKRFDFTHTIKTHPQAPRRTMGTQANLSDRSRRFPASGSPIAGDLARVPAEPEQSLYGEYNNLQLGINLDPLDDAYLVRIIDETGTAVYEKAINAGNIVGLNVDISAYAEGRYTVTVENSLEVFTGEFEVETMGISDAKRDNGEMINDIIYNLQGQRLSTLQKGLNIVNGQKIFVK